MTELALTFLRLGFLSLLWLFVIATVLVLRKDLRAPRDLRPAGVAPAPKPAKPPRAPKVSKAKGTSLVVTEGVLEGTVVPLGSSQITIGRAPDSTLVVDDDYTSTRHARLYPSEGTWLVEDLGSTNGTWLDRTRITGPTAVPVGVPIRIGRMTLMIRK